MSGRFYESGKRKVRMKDWKAMEALSLRINRKEWGWKWERSTRTYTAHIGEEKLEVTGDLGELLWCASTCGESLAYVVQDLWEAEDELAELKKWQECIRKGLKPEEADMAVSMMDHHA